MKNQQPNWLKILYIVIFLAVAGYTYWQQNQQQLAENANPDSGSRQSVEVSEGRSDSNQTLKNSPLGDRVSKVNSDNSTSNKSNNRTTDSSTQSSSSVEKTASENSPENAAAKYGVTTFKWSKVQRNDFTSGQGLVYGMGPRNEHRLEHVFRHAEDQPDRPGPHGVFDGSHDEILTTLDAAYKLVKFRSSDVETKSENNRKVHLINMKKRVGYIGGQTGARKNNPPARKIRMVLEGTRVITAFPLWLMQLSAY